MIFPFVFFLEKKAKINMQLNGNMDITYVQKGYLNGRHDPRRIRIDRCTPAKISRDWHE